jgi:hypothetical protein
MVQAIQVLRFHLLELEKVKNLLKISFRCIYRWKISMYVER